MDVRQKLLALKSKPQERSNNLSQNSNDSTHGLQISTISSIKPRLLFTFGTGASFPAYESLDIPFERNPNLASTLQPQKKSNNCKFEENSTIKITTAINGELIESTYENTKCLLDKFWAKCYLKIFTSKNEKIDFKILDDGHIKRNETKKQIIQCNLLDKQDHQVIAVLKFASPDIADRFTQTLQEMKTNKPNSIL
ncbi:hypothetical protein TVAG_167390 [Trichomonas vaginalis G3]|uniref:RanBD1 domain-containing protein n=2 Tax=Trichomonas vaginalis (strain ATCC PRA-98 / G3) TaxID=412133 RepID=A2DEE6_TRIV3|nr:hypothetical protein TVAG_167390 [Trichomonas vaginalis G3]|eukprot:XP_001582350.1 hypothetical protein [Trichomonas vaginalis G3]